MGERGSAGRIGGTNERTEAAPAGWKSARKWCGRRKPSSRRRTERQSGRPMRGRVDYIHPMGRFHIVAFEVRGKTIKETFQGVEV